MRQPICDAISRTKSLRFSNPVAALGICSVIRVFVRTRIHTFGFDFKPRTKAKSLADASDILEYLHETIDEYAPAPFIHYKQQVIRELANGQRFMGCTSRGRLYG